MADSTEAQKKIEALEQLLGVKLPRDHEVLVEIKDPDAFLENVVGGAAAPLHQTSFATVNLNWGSSLFKVKAIGFCW